ncbi:MAG: PAS domain S-box protein [Verrucomicrobiales bacterium]|nr:PAS domain S-box protein [Verrucomicrobiales bacterium]
MKPSFFTVGVGASAGGLEALGKFFADMPGDCGLAFVVVQHLSPDHRSFMVELISKKTRLKVARAEDGADVKPGHVYMIPPGKQLKIFRNRLLLLDPPKGDGLRLPIDVFFRSLAEDQQHRAIGVVLSGTGSDGTTGLRAIKDVGGMVMVQSETSAQFDGMPRSAIATGLADFIAAPEEMPRLLTQYIRHPFVERPQSIVRGQASTEVLMPKIFALLREREKVDFSNYKPATIDRRIERRMSVCQIESLAEYVSHLETSPREAGTLFQEMLICVTRFFRDPGVWDFLTESVLPELVGRVPGQEPVRVWVPGCSTGEEAYTLAILFCEALQVTGQNREVKIFATDVSKPALETAANGLYSESMVSDVSPERLSKHFIRKPEGYEVCAHIRKMVVFARHDLLSDPPFTRLDLISCRNLLIYFQPVLQSRVMTAFQFGLKPEGVLLLGTSETTGELAERFQTLSVRHKAFRNRAGRRIPDSGARPWKVSAVGGGGATARAARQMEFRPSLEHITRSIIADFAPACIVVDGNLDVLHLFGSAGDFLRHPPGAPTVNLLKLAPGELTSAIATTMRRAMKSEREFTFDNVRYKEGRRTVWLRLRAKPVGPKSPGDPIWLLSIERVQSTRAKSISSLDGDVADYRVDQSSVRRIRELEGDLAATKENLCATVEELEAANEELQATNEELLASNEELQSTNEELQSVNEELQTVNSENQSRIQELIELSNDVSNLLALTQVATLFIDEHLRIRRASDAVFDLIGLAREDVGAPVEVLSRVMRTPAVVELVQEVLDKAKASECEVTLPDGRVVLLRCARYQADLRPTRSLVLSIIDISFYKRANRQFELALDAAPIGLMLEDEEGRITMANAAAERVFGLPRGALIGMGVEGLLNEGSRMAYATFRATLDSHPGVSSEDCALSLEARREGGVVFPVELGLAPVATPCGARVLVSVEDLSDRVRSKRLRQSEVLNGLLLDALPGAAALLRQDGTITHVNDAWRRFARENGGDVATLSAGVNYLEVCQRADGPRSVEAQPVLQGLRRVLSGEANDFEMEYPCHSVDVQRWFRFRAVRVGGGETAGLLVVHVLVRSNSSSETEGGA